MAEARFRLSTLLWAVAFATLAMAGLLSPANAPGVVGVVVLGHALTAIAALLDVASRTRRRGPDDAGFLTGVLLVFASVEAVGLVVARREGEANQALWFAVALSFAAAGIVAVRRRRGHDGAVAAQMFFHGVLIVPALAAFGSLAVGAMGTAEAARAFSGTGPVAKWLLIIGGSTMPPLFATLVTVLAYDLGRTSGPRSPVWPAMLAHQAAYVVIAARWAYDGI